jgi:hypothetical protein
MRKSTRSILQELSDIGLNRNTDLVIESRGSNIIQSAINLLDIGAAGGIEPRWEKISRKINYFGFESSVVDDDPFKKVQYQQSLLQGLPISSTGYNYQQPSMLTELMNAAGGAQKLWDLLFTPKTTTTTTPP